MTQYLASTKSLGRGGHYRWLSSSTYADDTKALRVMHIKVDALPSILSSIGCTTLQSCVLSRAFDPVFLATMGLDINCTKVLGDS
jgi:hypothetical protein